jgi:4-carboxymuconolactone decarboxylase
VKKETKMARVTLVQKDQAHPIMREVFKTTEEHGFKVLNLFKALANSPKIGRDFIRLGTAILFKGQLSPLLRELAILRVANLTDANYEWTQHVAIALSCGVSKEQIDDIPDWKNSTRFNEKERAVLLYTDEVTQNIRTLDGTFSKIKDFFNEQDVVELTVTIGYYGMVSRVLETLQIELEN